MPPAASTPQNVLNPPPPPDSHPLIKMAQRIARNREVLGLHYPSDSRAGRVLARKSFKLLLKCKTIVDPVNPQDGLIAKAKKEWV